jgi:hypothetical protein
VIIFVSPPSNLLANWYNPSTPLGSFGHFLEPLDGSCCISQFSALVSSSS